LSAALLQHCLAIGQLSSPTCSAASAAAGRVACMPQSAGWSPARGRPTRCSPLSREVRAAMPELGGTPRQLDGWRSCLHHTAQSALDGLVIDLFCVGAMHTGEVHVLFRRHQFWCRLRVEEDARDPQVRMHVLYSAGVQVVRAWQWKAQALVHATMTSLARTSGMHSTGASCGLRPTPVSCPYALQRLVQRFDMEESDTLQVNTLQSPTQHAWCRCSRAYA
jgi:hypothetical protein